jgi:acyl-CoA synthetase (AMP-forming)/AMP-acid ligase II
VALQTFKTRVDQNYVTTYPQSKVIESLLTLDPTGNNVVFVQDDQEWRRGQLACLATQIATGLKAAGVHAGDRVLLHLRNGPEIAACYLACFQLLSAPEIPRNGLGKIDRARLLKML